MHLYARRPSARVLALVTGACLMLTPATLLAQRGPARDAVIEFGRANETGDGWVNARVTVRYQFADCVGDVAVLYSMDRASLNVSGGYYFRGVWYQPPGNIGPSRPSSINFSGPVLDRVGRFMGSFADPYTQGGQGAGCIGQSKVVFTRKSKLGENSTAAQYLALLEELYIQPLAQPRYRDAAAEAWINGELTKQRDDSLARIGRDRERADSVRVRERREIARLDSLERAREANLAKERERADAETTRRDSVGRADERETAREEREDEERERKNALDRQVAGDAQTARLNAMFAVEKAEWELAEQALSRGDIATARPLLEKLAGSLVYGEQASARLAQLNEQELAQGISGLFSAFSYFTSKLEGTGLFLGPSYGPTGFPGDNGAAGLTVGFAMSAHQRWVPYVDLLMISLGSDAAEAQRYYPSKSLMTAVVGTTTPWLRLRLGANASLAPHFGYRAIGTDLRWINAGQTGLMLISRGLLVRGDVVIINGKAQYNGAIARVF